MSSTGLILVIQQCFKLRLSVTQVRILEPHGGNSFTLALRVPKRFQILGDHRLHFLA